MPDLASTGILSIDGATLEYKHLSPSTEAALTLVLLHEGLGCVGLWADFPEKLQAATGAGVFIYSRAGYGASSPVFLPRPLTYVHDEALTVLPAVLDRIGFQHGLLVGHSDGASIATIYAGKGRNDRICGVSLIAPHFVVEDVTVRSIAEIRTAYETGDLKRKLARWHADPDNALLGWPDNALLGLSGAWLDPDFRRWDNTGSLAGLQAPIQIVQGADDEYGTVWQIEIAKEKCACPLDATLIPGAAHSPQREQPQMTLDIIARFVNRALNTAKKPGR